MKSIKVSEYYARVNPTYKYLKIIPHVSVKNNKSDEIAAIVNSMYKKLKDRVIRENNKIIIQSQCKLAYYIYIKEKNVNFYFIVPEYYLDLIKNKIISSWGNKVNIEEVDEIPRFSDNCSKSQMVYQNKDGLSLDIDKRNNDLLSNNLSVINTMTDSDAVGIIYNMMPMSPREQRTWLTRYAEDYEAYTKNRNIEKLNLDAKNILKFAALNLLKGLDFFIKEIQTALAKEKINIEALNQVSSIVENRKKLSDASIKKKTDTIIKTQIAVFSESNNKHQQEKLLDTVTNSFEVVKGDNKLIPKNIKNNFDLVDPDFKLDTLECSDKELNNGIAIPGRQLLTEYNTIDKNELNESTLPDELKEGYIRLGTNRYKNSKEQGYFNSKPALINLPIAILGGSRSGKSTFSENICKDIIAAGEGLIIFDFIRNCELAEHVRRITPVDRLIDLDLSDPNCYQAFAYNEIVITEDMTPLQKIQVANKKIKQIMNLVDSMNADGKSLTGKMRRYLLSAGKIVLLNNNSSLKEVIKCLQNHNFRNDLINNIDIELKHILDEDIENLLELNEWDKKGENIIGTKDTKIEGIIDRINLLKEDPNMNIMYAANPKNNINFVESMNQGKVILIKLKESEYYDTLSKNILVTFFITKIWLSSLLRNTSDCKRCTVIIDEIFQTPMAQRLVGKQLVQSAKFNLKYIFTLHYLNQLAPDTKESLKSANASYVLISGCDKKAFKELEEEFNENEYFLSDLQNLEQHYALHLIKTSKSYASFITKLPPPITKTTTNKTPPAE